MLLNQFEVKSWISFLSLRAVVKTCVLPEVMASALLRVYRWLVDPPGALRWFWCLLSEHTDFDNTFYASTFLHAWQAELRENTLLLFVITSCYLSEHSRRGDLGLPSSCLVNICLFMNVLKFILDFLMVTPDVNWDEVLRRRRRGTSQLLVQLKLLSCLPTFVSPSCPDAAVTKLWRLCFWFLFSSGFLKSCLWNRRHSDTSGYVIIM